jgi:hypothetical protein
MHRYARLVIHSFRHVSVSNSREANTVRGLYLGALRLGPLTDR